MPLDRAEALEIIMLVCPHCAKGLEPSLRTQTNEWTHNNAGVTNSTTICWASKFRNSHFMTEIQNG